MITPLDPCNFELTSYFFHSGRWPEKSVKFITRLLKNAESNADAKNLELEDLTIKNIVVQQAPVRLHAMSIVTL